MKVTAAIVVFIIGQTFYNYLWAGAYYQCIAVGLVLLFWEIQSKTKGLAAEIGLILSLSNLADELFFDPKVIAINEYIFALIVILLIWKRHAANTGR